MHHHINITDTILQAFFLQTEGVHFPMATKRSFKHLIVHLSDFPDHDAIPQSILRVNINLGYAKLG